MASVVLSSDTESKGSIYKKVIANTPDRKSNQGMHIPTTAPKFSNLRHSFSPVMEVSEVSKATLEELASKYQIAGNHSNTFAPEVRSFQIGL